MKISVELADSDVKEICQITGEPKKVPAIRKLVIDALMLKRRQKIVQKVLDGEWSVEFKGYEESKLHERKAEKEDEARWRD